MSGLYGFPNLSDASIKSRLKRVERITQFAKRGINADSGAKFRTVAADQVDRDGKIIVTGTTKVVSGGGTIQAAPGPAGENGVGVPTGGTVGQVLTKNSATDYDTSWQTPSGGSGTLPDQTRLYYFEDFISGLITSGQIGVNGWRYDGASGGAYFQTGMPNGTYRGVIQLISGTSWCGLYLGAAYNNYQWVNPADTSIKFKTRLTPISSTQGKRRAGLLLQFGVADPSDGIYFEQTAGGSWMAVTRASSVETSTDTGVAYANGAWRTLEIDIAGSAATFKIDGTAVVTNQSTNFPTNYLLPGFECSYVSSNQAYMDIDYCLIDIAPAAAR